MQRGRFGRVSGQVARQVNTKQDVWGEAQQATATRCAPDSSQVPCPDVRYPPPVRRHLLAGRCGAWLPCALQRWTWRCYQTEWHQARLEHRETCRHCSACAQQCFQHPHTGPLPHELLSNRLAPWTIPDSRAIRRQLRQHDLQHLSLGNSPIRDSSGNPETGEGLRMAEPSWRCHRMASTFHVYSVLGAPWGVAAAERFVQSSKGDTRSKRRCPRFAAILSRYHSQSYERGQSVTQGYSWRPRHPWQRYPGASHRVVRLCETL